MSRPSLMSVDALITERHLLKHPFYRAWQDGTLSAEALRDYAAQYYRHVQAFPTYISALHSRCEDLATRQALLENLRDEEQGPENHPALWRRFAEAVGCSSAELEGGEAWPETSGAIDGFHNAVGEGPVVRGLAALYAYESMVPAVAAEKIRGLAEH
ncbi:MAG: CADD family putative folate metabolism protein [Gemmatimonadota bacterium]